MFIQHFSAARRVAFPCFTQSLAPRPLAVAGALVLLSTAAFSQPAAPASAEAAAATPATALPVVKVTGAQEQETATSPVPGYVARRSATATKTDTPLNEVPQSISVITAEQIKDQHAETLQEVLRYTAGVRSEMYGLDNRGDWFTLRGGSEGSTLLDGLRLPLTGWYGVLRNEPYAFERVEVLRGPASVVAGQNGPGGVVNLISKQPQATTEREVSMQLGNRDHRQIAADLTGPLNAEGTLSYRLVALTKRSDTQVEHAYEERDYFAPSLTWKPDGATSVTGYLQYQKDRSGNTNAFFPWAGTLLPGPHGRIPMETFVGEPDWDVYGGERTRVGYQVAHRFNDAWSLRHNARYDHVTGLMRSMYANFWEVDAQGNGFGDNANGPARTIGRTWYATDNKGRIANADLLAEGKLAWGEARHTVLIGLDAMSAQSLQKDAEGAATPLDVYAPVYGTFPLPAFTFGPEEDNRTRSWGLIAQDQVKLSPRWTVVGGLRRDHVKTTVNGRVGSDDTAWSKNLGAVFHAGGGWSPYASYSESFEGVAGAAADGTPFKPKRGKQLEAGVKWMPSGRRVMATAAVYKLKETNRLTTDPNDPNESVQRGEVSVQGVELEASASLPAWDLVAHYSYTDARDETLGTRLEGIPKHSAALWAMHRFGALPALRAGLGVRYAGKSWDGTHTLATPSYTLADAAVTYDWEKWQLRLNINNLFDKSYIATCLGRGDCWYGTRRKIVLTAAYRF